MPRSSPLFSQCIPLSEARGHPLISMLSHARAGSVQVSDAGASVVELLESWDIDHSGQLRKREWLLAWKGVVHVRGRTHIEVWDDLVRPAVIEWFERMDANGGGALSLHELRAGLRASSRTPRDPLHDDKPQHSSRATVPYRQSRVACNSAGAVAGPKHQLAPASRPSGSCPQMVSAAAPAMLPASHAARPSCAMLSTEGPRAAPRPRISSRFDPPLAPYTSRGSRVLHGYALRSARDAETPSTPRSHPRKPPVLHSPLHARPHSGIDQSTCSPRSNERVSHRNAPRLRPTPPLWRHAPMRTSCIAADRRRLLMRQADFAARMRNEHRIARLNQNNAELQTELARIDKVRRMAAAAQRGVGEARPAAEEEEPEPVHNPWGTFDFVTFCTP